MSGVQGGYNTSMLRMTCAFMTVFGVLVMPFVVGAQSFTDAIVPCRGVDCGLDDFAQLAQNLMNFGIFFASLIAAGLFAWAGFTMLKAHSTGDEHDIDTAKHLFWDVAIGFLIILGAWLVVDTLLGILLDKSVIGDWNVFNF